MISVKNVKTLKDLKDEINKELDKLDPKEINWYVGSFFYIVNLIDCVSTPYLFICYLMSYSNEIGNEFAVIFMMANFALYILALIWTY
jgi:hypothetical protein